MVGSKETDGTGTPRRARKVHRHLFSARDSQSRYAVVTVRRGIEGEKKVLQKFGERLPEVRAMRSHSLAALAAESTQHKLATEILTAPSPGTVVQVKQEILEKSPVDMEAETEAARNRADETGETRPPGSIAAQRISKLPAIRRAAHLHQVIPEQHDSVRPHLVSGPHADIPSVDGESLDEEEEEKAAGMTDVGRVRWC
ncbi:hypothetical protein CMUS01_05865 [Colletotrichum musicola]|uniref:Uncharacterized protein n=1 Tax=Colletotrichum musicola TaxID=2175873 RepID=A0A8H6KP54_9PEZI|nr:hypothetical protein CMUS01_05865 [Colletotrichum musicola]